MIQIKSFSYSYPNEVIPALKGIDLRIPEGQFCGIVGANGAGKSTLCYALTGFIPHFYRGQFEGQVSIAEMIVHETSLGDLAGEVGLVFQNPFNQISGSRFTVREEVAFGLENLGVSSEEMGLRVEQALAQTGLAELADRSPYALSGGQQQRLAIASMLAMQPRVLVLDEPSSQLDPIGTKEVFTVLHDLAASGGTTVILTEHKLEWLAASVDRVAVLHQGQVVADGPPSEVLAMESIDALGVRQTRYTRAARAAANRAQEHLEEKLPVTLEEAIGFFR